MNSLMKVDEVRRLLQASLTIWGHSETGVPAGVLMG